MTDHFKRLDMGNEMLKHLKYYKDLYRHQMSKEIIDDKFGPGTLSTMALVAVFSGAGGYMAVDDVTVLPDQDASANAVEIVEQLGDQKQSLLDQQTEFDALSTRITQESRAGNDIGALETEQTERSEAMTAFAQQLVSDALLSSELSEQQRQDFLTDLDDNVVDMSSIGFEALDGGDKVDALSHLREYHDSDEAKQTYKNNIERAQAMASFNDAHNGGSEAGVMGALGACLGLLLLMGGMLGYHRQAYNYHHERPKKPTKNGGFKH